MPTPSRAIRWLLPQFVPGLRTPSGEYEILKRSRRYVLLLPEQSEVVLSLEQTQGPESNPRIMELSMAEENKNYSLQVGGYNLFRDGQLITAAAPTVMYTSLTYANVQKLWAIVNSDPAVVAAKRAYDEAVAKRMVEIGDKLGLERSDLTQEDIKARDAFVAALKA